MLMQVPDLELPSRRVLQFRGNPLGLPRATSGANSPLGAHAPVTHSNCVAPNEAALRVRTSAGGLVKPPQATMMIATAYTQPMLQTPRDLLQMPPALQLDCNLQEHPRSADCPAQADLVKACAKVAPAIQKLPPARLRRRTARAAALRDSLDDSSKGGQMPQHSSTAAVPLAACRQFNLTRGVYFIITSAISSRNCFPSSA